MQNLLLNGLSIDWEKIEEDSYLRDIAALQNLQELDFHKPVTFFVGENGSGKSTLLEAIAVSYGFNPEGGTRNYSFSTYDSHSELCEAIRLSRGFRKPQGGYFLRAESFYNIASMEEEYSKGPGGRPQHLHEKSHGESFLAIVQNYFRPGGLYLLRGEAPGQVLASRRIGVAYAEKCRDALWRFIVAGSPFVSVPADDEKREKGKLGENNY